MVKPKKHLGQHFLTDPRIALRIVEAMEAGQEATVLEIGPGTGVLTGHLLDKGTDLVPIEIDSESAAFLKDKWPELEERLVEGDFLALDLNSIPGKTLHVIGNFPYNISSQIFFRVLDHRDRIMSIVCMVQKEVAERIAAPPGKRDYGILSVLLQAYYDIEYLFTVKPGSFHPPPRVYSGVIRLMRNDRAQLPCDEGLFVRLVKTLFNQRRKMIRNSIRPFLLHLDDDFELLTRRPEQLTVEDFIRLCRWLEENHEH